MGTSFYASRADRDSGQNPVAHRSWGGDSEGVRVQVFDLYELLREGAKRGDDSAHMCLWGDDNSTCTLFLLSAEVGRGRRPDRLRREVDDEGLDEQGVPKGALPFRTLVIPQHSRPFGTFFHQETENESNSLDARRLALAAQS